MGSRVLSVDAACAAVAGTQLGVITAAQLRAAGLSDDGIGRRVAAGGLIKMLPRVFRMAAAPRSWHQRAMAVSLWVGVGGGIAGHAAAAIYKLDGFAPPNRIEVATPRSLRAPHRLVVVRRRCDLSSSDLTTVAGIPVTSCVRALIEVAASVSVEQLELALEDARRRRIVRLQELEQRLMEMPRNAAGRSKVIEVLRMQEGTRPTESGLEVDVLQMLRGEGFPPPIRQEVLDDEGRFVGRVDFVYPERFLIIEVDSFRFHSGRVSWEKDRDRRNDLTACGWLVLHATNRMLGDGRAGFLRDLRKAYARAL